MMTHLNKPIDSLSPAHKKTLLIDYLASTLVAQCAMLLLDEGVKKDWPNALRARIQSAFEHSPCNGADEAERTEILKTALLMAASMHR